MRRFFEKWVEEFQAAELSLGASDQHIWAALTHIAFHGPERPVASLSFGPGLNVIYGASEVGKSFVVEAVDFMLGGRGPLRDIRTHRLRPGPARGRDSRR